MMYLAPAKINLYLHITHRRLDGYHLIDSLFVFTQFGDSVTITPASSLSFSIEGQFAAALSTESIENNLLYRAATLLQKKYSISAGAHIHLSKNIPVAAGLGGGSMDAAAVLKGLNALWDLRLGDTTLAELGLLLGADVPACLYQKPALVSGIGEVLKPVSLALPPTPIMLIKPPCSLSTQTVFSHYAQSGKPFSLHAINPTGSPEDFFEILKQNKNDLQESAISLMPEIGEILEQLQHASGCLLSKMSGSGPACFGIFSTQTQLQAAKQVLETRFPAHWITATSVRWV